MNKFTNFVRKNIGVIVSVVGLTLLVVLTFGNIGELFTEKYWENVGGNLSSISALTIGLVLIQTTIKQGISEQALSTGLNTENTKNKYKEHKNLIKTNQDKQIYLPYFLSIRNKRETERRKKEFLVDNNFSSESALFNMSTCKNFIDKITRKKLIKIYKSIQTNITTDSIKWSTTEIVYSKNGRIEKLETYRKKRLIKGLLTGFIFMIATTFITGGLFLDIAEIPFWQKVVKLITYLIVIALSVLFDIGKNYEKGAFGVPNELEEINAIWEEFSLWVVPDWVEQEVKNEENQKHINEREMGSQFEEKIVDQDNDSFSDKQILPEIVEKIDIKESEPSEEHDTKEHDTRTDLQEESIQSQSV